MHVRNFRQDLSSKLRRATCTTLFELPRVNKMISLSITCLIVLLVSILANPLCQISDANAISPATWSKSEQASQHKIEITVPISHYSNVMPLDCSHFATTSDPCKGTDTTYGVFSYTTPESYGIKDSCAYPCESQDVLVSYPGTFTYQGTTYYFSSARQSQCSPDVGCSTETVWMSTGPVSIPYSGTPVGNPVSVDTEFFYKNLAGSSMIEVEFTYNLDEGYGLG